MEVAVSKRCWECGWIELIQKVNRSLIVSLNLTSEDITDCGQCGAKAIRIDIDVEDCSKDRPWR
jgi:hypothetical protein